MPLGVCTSVSPGLLSLFLLPSLCEDSFVLFVIIPLPWYSVFVLIMKLPLIDILQTYFKSPHTHGM